MSVSSAEILIKPVSMRCNLTCDYCFYLDECQNREESDKGIMSKTTAEALIKRALQLTDNTLCFTFQGGEPTLAGLDFFEFFVNTANKLNNGKRELLWSIQSNGTLFDEEWASFLKDNNFLVGISIDGPKELHEKHRGKGSYDQTIKGLSFLRRVGISTNVLSVVTNDSTFHSYEHFKSLGFSTIQYIPCLEAFGKDNLFLSAQHFGDFLVSIYDLWIKDLSQGKIISIRYFENLALILNQEEAESCNFCGGCKLQFVTEANGDVYPCDFYCTDEYKLGNIIDSSYEDMARSNIALSFTKKRTAQDYSNECKKCKYFKLCKAGCKREFSSRNRSQFCEAYIKLFKHIESKAK